MLDINKMFETVTNDYRKNILGLEQLEDCDENKPKHSHLTENETNVMLDNRERANDMNNI